jgi:hypothetical protein
VKGRYIRFEAERKEMPVEVALGKEVKFQDRWAVVGMKKISQIKERDARRFKVIMTLLEANEGMAFSMSEIRWKVKEELGEVETKGLKKLIEKMAEVGAINAGWSQVQQMRYYSKA